MKLICHCLTLLATLSLLGCQLIGGNPEPLSLSSDTSTPKLNSAYHSTTYVDAIFIDARKDQAFVIVNQTSNSRAEILEAEDEIIDGIFEQFQSKLNHQGIMFDSRHEQSTLPEFSETRFTSEVAKVYIELNDLMFHIDNSKIKPSIDAQVSFTINAWRKNKQNMSYLFNKRYPSKISTQTSNTDITLFDANELLNKSIDKLITEIVEDPSLVAFLHSHS